jgi:uncharacterized protein YqeY
MAGTLKTRLSEDMKTALRAGDKARLGAIRLMLAAIKQREIDTRQALDDTQVLGILDKMVKQRRDSIAQYQAARREDLVSAEQFELEVISDYLPAALSEAEVEQLIDAALEATSARSAQDMGKVMGHLKPQLQGRADMALVSTRVKTRLTAH